MKLSDVKLDRSEVSVFHSFKDADEADRLYWHSKSPAERLAALELMRQSAYGYDDSTTRRLQRVLEVVRGV